MGSYGTPRQGRARVYFALVACVMWLAGVEGLPALHQAMHDRIGAHRHDGALIIPIDELGRDAGPALAALADHDDAPAHPQRVTDDAHARLARSLAHGRGSLAHRDLALKAPAIPLHAPLPIDRKPTSLVAAAIATPVSALAPRASARGPPA